VHGCSGSISSEEVKSLDLVGFLKFNRCSLWSVAFACFFKVVNANLLVKCLEMKIYFCA
jgi:hypothetical protein